MFEKCKVKSNDFVSITKNHRFVTIEAEVITADVAKPSNTRMVRPTTVADVAGVVPTAIAHDHGVV